jgi:hypothetical protein
MPRGCLKINKREHAQDKLNDKTETFGSLSIPR